MKYGAFGLVEVLGSCNAVMVIDQMLKTADVSFRTWNGKCGGHEVVFMSGDVSAVTAAVPIPTNKIFFSPSPNSIIFSPFLFEMIFLYVIRLHRKNTV